MAQRNTFNGIKVIPRYSAAQFFTGLFCLILAAVLILPLFTDVFSVTITYASGESETIVNTGMDYMMSLFQQAESPMAPIQELMVWEFELIGAGTVLVWIEYVFVVFMIVGLIYALFFILYALGFIFRGLVKRYTAPRRLSILAFILILVDSAIFFGYMYLVSSTGFLQFSWDEIHEITFSISLYSYIYLGVSLVDMILIIIVVNACFVGKVRVKDLPYTKEYIREHSKDHYFVPGLEEDKEKVTNTTTTIVPNITIQNIPAPLPLTSENKEQTPTTLPPTCTSLGGHDFAANTNITQANIPNSITYIGTACFSNCLNLESVSLPADLIEIGPNAFFNCCSLKQILYPGTKADFRNVKRGSNWLYKAGTNVIICKDGAIQVNPYK